MATTDEGFLRGLGRSVRATRNRRGMTRKMLAAEADVSERHLAQLEAGDGNISVLLLAANREALERLDLAELFDESNHASAAPERETGRYPTPRTAAQQIAAAKLRGRLRQRSGKLDGHAQLAHRVDRPSRRGQIHARRAAAARHEGAVHRTRSRDRKRSGHEPRRRFFRCTARPVTAEWKTERSNECSPRIRRAIISVGGGVVSERETYDRLLASCFTVWVKANPEEHMARVVAQGDLRAMAENDEAMEDLRDILAAREPLYGMADFQLETSGDSVDQSFAKLKRAIAAR